MKKTLYSLMLNEEDKEHARSIVQKALSKQFSPEFLNRLDEIITFDQLDMDAIKQIIDIELKGLYKRIEQIGHLTFKERCTIIILQTHGTYEIVLDSLLILS